MTSRITFVISSLRGGGAENVCVTLANELTREGYKIDLVVLNLNNEKKQEELSDKVRLIDLSVNRARNSFFLLKKYLQVNNPSKILSFNTQLSIILVVLRRLFNFEFKLYSRCISNLLASFNFTNNFFNSIASIKLTKSLYPMSDVIIAQCSEMKADLINFLGVREEKIAVINNPINRNLESVSKSLDFSSIQKGNYLLCVGRLEKEKAFHFAIEAFSGIAKNYPFLRLKFVGQGSLENQLRKKAEMLGIEDRVDFEGFKSNLVPYYLGAHATVLTSLYEGFPNVLLESLCLGTPVVSFDLKSGPSELILDGINGCLVKYQDLEHLELCLESVLNKNFNAEYVRNTVERFSTETIVEEYINVLFRTI